MKLNITFVAIAKKENVLTKTFPSLYSMTDTICKPFYLLGYVFFFMFILPQFSLAQDRLEVGPFVGVSYYFGDLNPDKQFANSHLAIGGIGRYVVNDRLAVKGSVLMATVSGAYNENEVRFPNTGRYSFSRGIGDASVQLEINFLSYDHKFISTTVFSPYVCFGLGSTIYKRYEGEGQKETEKSVFVLSLPFGVGLKYKISKWVRVGAEWSFRKTFVDDLDLVGHDLPIQPDDPYGFEEHSSLHNNDWYSFAGVYITFSFLNRRSRCNGGF
ncbi:hypothetical protein DMA11_09140 [Marinilabiliaceae bacterium JC017]|nr:hypothetical protein DMA11_09140 [Marinilabiliaceae bacterium JC017]